MSLLLAILGYFFLACVMVMDKYILSKTAIKPAVLTFYSSAPLLAVFFLLFFGVKFPDTSYGWSAVLAGGLGFFFGLWAMFKSFREGEVSHMGPLVGAATPFFVLIVSRLFLREVLSVYQIIGILVLVFGTFLISFEKSKKHHGLHIGFLWGMLAGFLFAVSHVGSKYAYDSYGFLSGLMWTRGFLGLPSVFLLLLPSLKKEFFSKKKKNKKSNSSFSWKNLLLVYSTRGAGVIGVLLVQYAIALGSVTIVNAMAGLQFALLVVLVAVLSKIAPKIFKERYEKGEALWEGLSVAVIVVGLVMLVAVN